MQATHTYQRASRALVLLLPAMAITLAQLVVDPARLLLWHSFHEGAVMVAIVTAAFLGFVAYRSYLRDGSEFLAYLALGYWGFAVVYAPHGLLTRAADHHLILFLVFGPVSRLVMAAYMFVSLLRLGRGGERRVDLRPHLVFFALLAMTLVFLVTAGVGVNRSHLRWTEAFSGLLSLSAVVRLQAVKVRSSLLTAHLTAQVFFAQCSAAFLLASPWNGLWWLAHAISAAGFILLGYAIVQTHERTHAYDRIYDETTLYGLLDRIMETSPVGFLVTDAAFRPVRTNRAIHRMLGAEGGSIISERLLAQMGLEPGPLHAAPSQPLELAFSFRYEIQGEARFYEARISPIGPPRLDEGYLCVLIDTTEANRAKEEIRHLAFHDALTGLPNRLLLYDRLDMVLALAGRHGRTAAVMMLDLDGFKAVNDRYGHDAGDEVLRVVASRLRNELRECDTAARLAGDEFVLVLSEIAGPADAEAVAERLLSQVALPIPFGSASLHVTASIGICLSTGVVACKHAVLKRADTAMYQAKQAGRNTYAVAEENEAVI